MTYGKLSDLPPGDRENALDFQELSRSVALMMSEMCISKGECTRQQMEELERDLSRVLNNHGVTLETGRAALLSLWVGAGDTGARLLQGTVH